MAAPTEIYVDPSIAANSGSGTSGDPYGDVQYALNTMTRDATNGDRLNIKAGTAEVLTGILSLATYGTPTVDAPLLFEGYTSVAGDGGIGDLNGNGGNFSILPSTQFIGVRNMKLRNTGTASIIATWAAINWNFLENVEFSTCTNVQPVIVGSGCRVMHCSFVGFTTASQMCLTVSGPADIIGNWFEQSDGTACLSIAVNDGCTIKWNILNCGGVANGIRFNSARGHVCEHNSILSSGGTGSGILLNSSACEGVILLNNIIAGFSGVGGKGVEVGAGSKIGIYGYNYFYNNATDESGVSGAVLMSIGGNELAGASDPFAKSGANTFANRFTYFEPNDVGSIHGGAYPVGCRFDKGAVQHADPAGGGSPGNLIDGGLVY